ncbi:DUF3368 domain-containing protein [Thiothrix nivea]|uniref:Nucleic acid binding protein n=1 Tax=Thiothrix nivea (strain ATCC 35100 / DSM 5205 / JP2) TaxID=870187 RepID=A0A656HCL3_THINJ|nr:DUF3368 domain-containing protein [Thiothrix nivea]EIJ32899.1 nucleic acid binding protein [Thiothrix nivea DSM 5205]
MKPIIVADTSPLIALAKLRQLELLPAIFAAIHLPQKVLDEATCHLQRTDACLIRDFAHEHFTLHPDADNDFCVKLRQTLDEGEVQALHLAKKLACGVLMDELSGRRVAQSYLIPVVGVLGVLLKARQSGVIASLSPLIAKLQQEDYRLSASLIHKVLQTAGETA